MKKKQKGTSKLLLVFAAVLLVLGILLDTVSPHFASSLTVAMRYTSVDESSHSDALETGYALNREAESEGIVLLRNERETLPITEANAKVNVFGVRSAHLVLNSAGSAAGSNAEAATLKDGLEQAGFTVNPDLWALLDAQTIKDNNSVNEDGASEAVEELPLTEYTGNCALDAAKSYSEYAIVTFSRLGGEGADQTRSGMGEAGDRSYLELASGEEALLKALCENNYKIIVLINSSYPMALGALEEYDVDAALWIGGPGVKGALAIGDVLNGTVNPSGRLVDTYAYDFSTASTFIPSDKYKVLNESGDEIGGYTDYAEGIYYGYRWYETADAEGFWTSDYAKTKWNLEDGYADVVQYPFGYGLSYTSFSQAFDGEPVYDAASGKLTFPVQVTNTGAAAGKEVVQLYVESPYQNGGVEKSKVALAAFEKTSLLAAGAGETVMLTVPVEELASYDVTANGGAGAYVLDAGDYTFYLSSGETGAHCWKAPQDSRTVALDGIVYAGENKRSSDATVAVNRLENGAIRNGEAIPILSRTDGFANAEETVFTAREDITVKEGDPLYEALVTTAAKASAYQGSILSDLSVEQKGNLKLADLIDTEAGYADYDDERWDKLLAQMSIDDLITLTGTGGWSTAAIPSINKVSTTDIDGPFGLSNLIKNTMGVDVKCVSYCSEVIMASTWNTVLIERIGEAVADEAEVTDTAGWYAPGANIHRTPFGGRNPEYYSEDALLSGRMCAAEVSGALSKGLYVYVKHFAFNDTEANRTSKQNCYIDEQTAREIYLKPFEIAIKNDRYDAEGNRVSYGATGLMSSYMWYEENWDGANYDLMTGILRDEWNFRGMVITDNAAVSGVNNWITLNKAVYGGTDLMLVYNTAKMSSQVASSPEGTSALKKAAKHILWTIADASSRRTAQGGFSIDFWRIAYISLNVIFFGGAVVLAGLWLKKYLDDKKKTVQKP